MTRVIRLFLWIDGKAGVGQARRVISRLGDGGGADESEPADEQSVLSKPQNIRVKVGIFVDVQNVYYTCRQIYQRNFDYNKFWSHATEDRELIGAYAYATDRGDAKQMQFQNILHAIGFTVKLRPVLKRLDGTSKADWDVGIALDVFEQANQCDRVVLVTGDGDFDVLLERIRNRFGTQSEVYGVPELTSNLLVKAADRFVPIDKSLLLM